MMTKTHAELLNCPFCGKKPAIYPVDPEKEGGAWAEVRCDYVKCVANPHVRDGEKTAADDINYKQLAINRWNTRTNKEAAFLEELKASMQETIDNYNDKTDFQNGKIDAYRSVIKRIEQFEQEKLNNENK